MAKDSIREQIIISHEKILTSLRSIRTVTRVKLSYSDLQQFAVTQFPLVAVVAGLPVPDNKWSSRKREDIDIIISSLSIQNFVYVQINNR